MDALDALKARWIEQKDHLDPSFLEEYGASVSSWMLEHLENKTDVEAVIASHLINNTDLLDHCAWEIIPLMYRHEWMQSSPVRIVFSSS